ncbi:MAG: flagellar export protein FliJ [Actinomycetota bacterium]|nr:flagellar export protein FliJ [Actinomycetota bacterium]
MSDFKFKLQPVLNFREQQEDSLKRELAKIRGRYEEERMALDALINSLLQNQREFKRKQAAGVEISELFVFSCFFAKIQEDITVQAVRVQSILSELEAMRDRLIEASKDKKIIEKIYDKQYEEFCQMVLKTEQKLIDELATSRYKRNQIASLLTGDEKGV